MLSIRTPYRFFTAAWLATLMVSLTLIGVTRADAAGTPAGTTISNQVTVTYTDANDVAQTPVTSNVVTTTVAQGYGVNVYTANTPQNTLPGTTVYYPVRVTNIGNGPDSFSLTATGTQAGWTRTIYLDADGDGVVDPTELPVTSTGVIAMDQTKHFVVAVVVPTSATAGTTDTMTVTATSAGDANVSDSATAVTNVTEGAVLSGTKSASPASIDPLDANAGNREVTYTITVTNTGKAPAQNVQIDDTLPTTSAGVATLVEAAVSSSGGTITYAADAVYEAYNAANKDTYTKVRLVLPSLGVNASATFTFKVLVPQNSAPGVMPNFATLSATDLEPVPTNTANVTLRQSAAVDIEAAQNQSLSAGGTVSFTHTVTNNGNGADTVNIVPTNVPAGWIVRLFNADGVTPLPDTNGDGIADTGHLAAGAVATLVVKVTAPNNAAAADYTVDLQARSVFDSNVTDSLTDTVTVAANPTLTLTKSVDPASAKPGDVVTWTITYTVAGNTAKAVVIKDVVPANVTVVSVNNGGELNGGAIVWSVGDVAVGNGSVSFTARINSGVAAGTEIINQAVADYQNGSGTPQTQAQSNESKVTVDMKAGLTFAPNNAANAAPGVTQVYQHVLTNTGNGSDNYTLTFSSLQGWTYTAFVDVNEDGILDDGDTRVDAPLTVAAGASVKLLVRVQVPAGTPGGQVDTVTVTATSTDVAVSASVQDTTTVISAAAPNLVVNKSGGVDTTAGEYTFAGQTYNNNDGKARPGATLKYTVTVTNNGTGVAKNVVVKDPLPEQATLVEDSATPTTGDVDVADGVLTWEIDEVAPGTSVTLTFRMTVN